MTKIHALTIAFARLYINEFESPRALRRGITAYVEEYNNERPHSSHGGDYPAEVYLRFAA